MADVAKPTPADLTATDALAALAEGALSAVALTQACLARIEATDGSLQAWKHVDRAGALAAAEAADQRRRAGLPLGPLHGIPVGVKDIVDVAGMPCERGSGYEAGRVPREDATVVRRLRAAGAVILGKTQTTELASYPPAPTMNPHGPARTPGGSSAGSAAAVAAGQVPLAIATQTNGSIIRPAAFCGAVGYKPSFGAVPATGVMPFATSLDHIGLIGRSVADVALLEHLTGPDGRDQNALPQRLALTETAAAAPPMAPVLGFLEGPTWSEAEDWLPEAFAEVLNALPSARHIATPSALSRTKELIATIMAVEAAYDLGGYLDNALAEPEDARTLHPVLVEIMSRGRATTAPDYLAARAAQGRLRAAFDEVFEEVDAILTPAVPGEAPGRETTGNPAFCSLWSLTGLPAITLPLLRGPAGLPVGIQLVGPMGDDARLLRTARWLAETLSGGDA
ncbi:MAG: amidase [Pseudomonadota bacterium]